MNVLQFYTFGAKGKIRAQWSSLEFLFSSFFGHFEWRLVDESALFYTFLSGRVLEEVINDLTKSYFENVLLQHTFSKHHCCGYNVNVYV